MRATLRAYSAGRVGRGREAGWASRVTEEPSPLARGGVSSTGGRVRFARLSGRSNRPVGQRLASQPPSRSARRLRRRRDRREPPPGFVARPRAAGPPPAPRRVPAPDELHDVVVDAFVLADAEDRHDVRVVQPGRGLGLAVEPEQDLGVVQPMAVAAP